MSIACPSPECSGLIPPFESKCKRCGTVLSVQVVAATVKPAQRKFRRLIAPTPLKIAVFKWSYLFLSLLVFWLVAAHFEDRLSMELLKRGVLSSLYVGVFILLTLWIFPRDAVLAAARTMAIRIKLALVLNCLTALFAFELLVFRWWARFLSIGMLFAIIWVGAVLFWKVLWPVAGAVARFFSPPSQAFDPTAPQGRAIRHD